MKWLDVGTLSRRRAVVLGGGHSTPLCAHRSSKNLRVSGDRGMKGKFLKQSVYDWLLLFSTVYWERWKKGCKWGNLAYVNRDKGVGEQRLTIAVVAVRWRELDSHYLLQVVSHAHSPEWRGEVNLKGLSLWTIRVVRHLVSSSDVLHHSWGKEGNTCLNGSLYTFSHSRCVRRDL